MSQQNMQNRRDAGKSSQQLDSNQVGMLKVWVAIMPDYMKKLDEIHNVMLGRIDTPSPTAGLIEEIRNITDEIQGLKTNVTELKAAYNRDAVMGQKIREEGFARILKLEQDSIIFWIKRNKKTALLVGAAIVVVVVPEVRVPVFMWIQENWLRLAIP